MFTATVTSAPVVLLNPLVRKGKKPAASLSPDSTEGTALVAVMVPKGQDPDAAPLCPQCQLTETVMACFLNSEYFS